ncbi:Hydroxypyruvate isomerase [Lacunisphaera limnophila]|uniref:Hydroxypyruvate isomerase n=1 Tax=Lacunisphaera limnophila TaxID=1838286 RepID=A0A1D8AZD0_9BACT|nr:TIM barrel protein [Lacunisphaera limnophila]AOS46250.1 Hydroxypyruvate isomerase [Lacunisphaera limnophila]
MTYPVSRRTALKQLGAGTVLASGLGLLQASEVAAVPSTAPKGRIKQSVCQWCFRGMPLDELCAAAAGMGLKSVELLGPKDFPTLKKHGLICAMVTNPTAKVGNLSVGGISHAWNRLEYHDALVPAYEAQLQAAAEAGYPSVICFSGNRAGMSDAQGLENCVIGLKRILPLAEKLGVNVVMELLNSRVNHADYMCDRTEWGVELCRRAGSERLKLLYDIYHMQIMEGDVIATIRRHHQYIGHYHTAGVPGRNELDENQELFYPAIMRAIVETGYQGYVGQEFIPRARETAAALAALQHGVRVCDV